MTEEAIIKRGEEMLAEGFDLETYMSDKWDTHSEWCTKRSQEVGEEQFKNESAYFGHCTCGHRFYTFDLIATLYGVCFKCKKHQWIEWGYVCDSPLDEQAIRYLVILNTDAIP